MSDLNAVVWIASIAPPIITILENLHLYINVSKKTDKYTCGHKNVYNDMGQDIFTK